MAMNLERNPVEQSLHQSIQAEIHKIKAVFRGGQPKGNIETNNLQNFVIPELQKAWDNFLNNRDYYDEIDEEIDEEWDGRSISVDTEIVESQLNEVGNNYLNFLISLTKNIHGNNLGNIDKNNIQLLNNEKMKIFYNTYVKNQLDLYNVYNDNDKVKLNDLINGYAKKNFHEDVNRDCKFEIKNFTGQLPFFKPELPIINTEEIERQKFRNELSSILPGINMDEVNALQPLLD